MTERIIERVAKRTNGDIQKWYQAKVTEMAHFLVKRVKEDAATLKKVRSNECKALEVMTK